jgi:hypothetical protein
VVPAAVPAVTQATGGTIGSIGNQLFLRSFITQLYPNISPHEHNDDAPVGISLFITPNLPISAKYHIFAVLSGF